MKPASIRHLCLIALATITTAHAADYDDSARVVRVTPQVEQVNQPRQECNTEYVQAAPQRNVGGSILGGVAGGILGNQVGGGNGRTVATAAGAIAGAIVGDRVENNQQQGQQAVQRCRMVDSWESRNNGYAVTYEYNGRTYTSVMPYDPGQRVRLRVSLNPVLSH